MIELNFLFDPQFLARALDHPELRGSLPGRVLAQPALLEAVADELAKELVVRDVVEGGSDWLGTLSEDLCAEDDCAVLAVVMGRASPQLYSAAVFKRLENAGSMAPPIRAAYYTLLESIPVKPFPLIESILVREGQSWNRNQALILWPVFRSCCKLVESASFAVTDARQFDVCFNFLVFVVSDAAMNVICKVHAALALRRLFFVSTLSLLCQFFLLCSLVEWQRVSDSNHVASRLTSSSQGLCMAVVDLFRACYDNDQTLEDDLAENILLQLLPLQAEVRKKKKGPFFFFFFFFSFKQS